VPADLFVILQAKTLGGSAPDHTWSGCHLWSEASKCSIDLLLFWLVIFFTLTLIPSCGWYEHGGLIYVKSFQIIVLCCFFHLEWCWRVDNICQCIMSCAFAFTCIWSRSRSYGCDSTGTHHALPEEGCDVKDVMAFAFLCIHEGYLNIICYCWFEGWSIYIW
jgi:hypothetical protein